MNRKQFLNGLGLLGLTSCDDDMSLFHSLLSSDLPTVQIGDLLNDDFNRASLGSSYTSVFGTATASIVSNKLQYNRVGSGTLGNDYLYYNGLGAMMLNDFYASITFELKQLNTTSNGLSLGVKSREIYSVWRDIIGFYNTKTDSANYKKIQIFQRDTGINNTKTTSAASTWTPVLNDVIKIEVSMVDLLFTVTVTNITQSGSTPLVHSYQFTLSSPNLFQTTYWPCIWCTGGQHNITSFIFGSTEWKNGHLCIIGDSTIQGVGASSYANSTQALFIAAMTGNHKATKCGVGSSLSDDVVAAIDNLKLINARYYLIRIGSNDVAVGAGQQHARDNLAIIVPALESIGRTVILSTPLARNSAGMSTISNGIIADFPSNTVIDSFTFSRDGATTNLNPAWTADGTHLNDTGQGLDKTDILDDAPQII